MFLGWCHEIYCFADPTLTNYHSSLDNSIYCFTNTGLTTKERHKATKLIACQHELVDVSLSMLNVENEEWVKDLINSDF